MDQPKDGTKTRWKTREVKRGRGEGRDTKLRKPQRNLKRKQHFTSSWWGKDDRRAPREGRDRRFNPPPLIIRQTKIPEY